MHVSNFCELPQKGDLTSSHMVFMCVSVLWIRPLKRKSEVSEKCDSLAEGIKCWKMVVKISAKS